MLQLPKGYYAVQADFENAPKDQFTYRGVTYTATEGVNLFGTPQEALAAATETPDAVLEGLPYERFSAPVLLFSVGTHRIDKLALDRDCIFLGEKAGVSPNLPAASKTDAPVFNEERAAEENESVLYGGYWYGTMRVSGPAISLFLVDGFYWQKARLADGRVTGECDTEILLKNIYHTSPCLHTIYTFAGVRADSPMHRSITMENVRLFRARKGWFATIPSTTR